MLVVHPQVQGNVYDVPLKAYEEEAYVEMYCQETGLALYTVCHRVAMSTGADAEQLYGYCIHRRPHPAVLAYMRATQPWMLA